MLIISDTQASSRWRITLGTFGALLICWSLWSSAIVPTTRSRHLQKFDYDAVDLWIDHIQHFPIEALDRYALHEMGFRTKTYANALSQWQDIDVQRLDSILWPFLPFARELRNAIGLPLGTENQNRLHRRSQASKIPRRGIVTTSDGDRLRKTLETVSNLRSVQNCTLPIEIYYDDEKEIPEIWQVALSSMADVHLYKILDIPFIKDEILGYAQLDQKTTSAEQAIAMVASTLQQIIFIEPGTTFFVDPEQLFQEQGYRDTGTLFFHSSIRTPDADSQRLVTFLNRQLDRGSPSKDYSRSPFYYNSAAAHQDPSVVVLDKTRPNVFSGLLFNLWLHSKAVRNALWHIHFLNNLHETLWIAFELAKLPYHFAPSFPGAIGHSTEKSFDTAWDSTICPAHPLHILGQEHDAKHKGQPVWASGSLHIAEGHSEYLNPNSWTRTGKWHLTEQGWCVSGTQPRSTSEFSLAALFQKAVDVDTSLDGIIKPLFSKVGTRF